MGLMRYLKEHRLAGGVVILATTQLGASVAGLMRDRLLAQVFAHNLGVVDAYIAAFRPSDLLFQTCIMSAMGTVLVPVLAGYHAKGDNKEMGKVLSGATGMAAIVFGIIALILSVVFPWVAPALVHFEGETLRQYIAFGQLALLVNFLFVFGNSLGQYLITVERYWMYGLTPILYTAGTIFGTVILTPYLGSYGPMYGTILGAVIYVFLRLIAVVRAGGVLEPKIWHADVPEMVTLMIPRILAFGAFQGQLLFLDKLASGFAAGSITINSYARNFQSVLVGVVGIAIAQSVYSILSQAAAQKKDERFRSYFAHGILLCLALTVPGAVALVALAPVAARLVSLSNVLSVFTVTLGIYAISIPFESISHLQYRAFYAMKETLLPAIIGVLGGVAAVVISWMFAKQYGVYSIAIGYTVGEVAQVIGLALLLPIKLGQFMKKPNHA